MGRGRADEIILELSRLIARYLGHGQITTTQRYCRVANLKVQRDYYKAMQVVLQKTQAQQEDDEGESMELRADAENELS